MVHAIDNQDGRRRGRESHGRNTAPHPGAASQAGAPPQAPRLPRFSSRNAYSRMVGILKLLLPATAAALILTVIAWQQFDPTDNLGGSFSVDVLPQDAREVSVINPRWDGFDENNQPFTVTADVVSQAANDSDLYELELPKADITLEDGTWIALTARSGRFRLEQQQLELRGNVDLFHDQGFEIRTESALIDLETKDAQGDSPVEGHGPAGRLEGEGFRITQEGERVFLTGKSRLIVYPEADEMLQ